MLTEGAPWVAQRVWPMPTLPAGSEPFMELTRLSSFPEAFRTAKEPPEVSTAIPALS